MNENPVETCHGTSLHCVLLRPKTLQLANLLTCQRKARNEQVVFGRPFKVTSEDETLVTAAQVATELGCLRMWHRPRAAAKEHQ